MATPRPTRAFGFGDLALDLFLDFLPLRFGVLLGGLALALDELLGGLLSLGYTLFNLPSRLAVGFLDAGATPLAHLARAVGELLGRPRGLDGSLLGVSSMLRGVMRAACAGLDGVADRRGVYHGCRHLPALVACAGIRARSNLAHDRDEAGVQDCGLLLCLVGDALLLPPERPTKTIAQWIHSHAKDVSETIWATRFASKAPGAGLNGDCER